MSSRLEVSELVIAIVSVAGSTAACSRHGDKPTVDVLADYYSLAAEMVRDSDGRIIKVMGNGVIIAFPVSRARDAVVALRSLQQRGTNLWQRFDPRCRVQVEVGVGAVLIGPLGPPGEEREDLYGDALNQLFKLPAAEFLITPDLAQIVGPV